MANINSLQLLRNTTQLYANRAAALTALTGGTLPSSSIKDGTPVLARYKGANDKIMTLVGYYADYTSITGATGGTNMTVFDYEGNAEDINEIISMLGTGVTTADTVTKQLADLSGTTADTSATTSVAGAKKYADAKVNALDASTVSGASKVIIDVTQADGQITASAANLTGVKLDGYAEASATGDVATTDTLGQALGKLQKTIHSMDKTASAENGKVVTTVSEADGVVSETKANVKDLQLGGYSKGSETGAISGTDTINTALTKIENNIAAAQSATTLSAKDKSVVVDAEASGTTVGVNIKSGEKVIMLDNNAGGGIYTDIKLSAVTVSSSNVKEEYALIASDGTTQLGTSIKIYKDSSLYSVYLGHLDDAITSATDPTVVPGTGSEALCFIYQKADGTYELVAVDVESFLQESEFASGVTADSSTHIVHGVVDSTSEKDGQSTPAAFLTVGAGGFKISGIKDEITRQINLLDASVSGGSTAGTATSDHVKVVVDEVDGKLTAVTVSESNIADKSKLEELSGKTFTVATSSNSSITTAVTAASDGTKSVDLITDASKIKMSGFTAATSGLTGITEASSITQAFKVVETEIITNEEVLAASINDLNTRINELDSGSSADISAEIAARKAVDGQTGDTYVANSGKKYISGATSLNDADIKLNDALESLTTNYIDGVKVNNVALAETNHIVNVQISAGSTAANDANAIHVDTNSSTGAITLTLGSIDAGTY